LHHWVEAFNVPLLPDLVVGVVAGALALAVFMGWQKISATFKPK
jgi:hypothetical protein